VAGEWAPPRDYSAQLCAATGSAGTAFFDASAAKDDRWDKFLQHAIVKISNALSDIFGVSGHLMLDALLEGKATPRADRRVCATLGQTQDSGNHL
jgi:hypothetical protein